YEWRAASKKNPVGANPSLRTRDESSAGRGKTRKRRFGSSVGENNLSSASEQAAVDSLKLRHPGRGDRRAEQEALSIMTSAGAQISELIFIFHTLGHGADDGGVAGIGFKIPDEAAVDLDDVDRKLLEVGERSIAGAEIVQRDGNAGGAQSLQIIFHHLARS